MISEIDGLRAVFAEISGTVKVLFEDSFEFIDLFLFLVELFLLLEHLFFVWVHEFSDHILELDNLLFHAFVEGLGLFEVVLEFWDGYIFNFDNRHEFVDDEVRHFDDFLFKEVELCGEGGQYGFEIQNWLMEWVGSVMANGRSLTGNAGAIETYKLSGCLEDIVPFIDHFFILSVL